MSKIQGFFVFAVVLFLCIGMEARADHPYAKELRQELPYEEYLSSEGLTPKETLRIEEIDYSITVFKDGSSERCKDGDCSFFTTDCKKLSFPVEKKQSPKKFGFASQIAHELTKKTETE